MPEISYQEALEYAGLDDPIFEDKIIEVCAACKRACCWYGEFMCSESTNSNTEKLTVAALREINAGENEEYWSDKKMTEVYGEPAPFGHTYNR